METDIDSTLVFIAVHSFSATGAALVKYKSHTSSESVFRLDSTTIAHFMLFCRHLCFQSIRINACRAAKSKFIRCLVLWRGRKDLCAPSFLRPSHRSRRSRVRGSSLSPMVFYCNNPYIGRNGHAGGGFSHCRFQIEKPRPNNRRNPVSIEKLDSSSLGIV